MHLDLLWKLLAQDAGNSWSVHDTTDTHHICCIFIADMIP